MTTSTSISGDNITFRWACVFLLQRRKPAVFCRFLSGVWTHLFMDHRELRKDNDREGPYGNLMILMFEVVSYIILKEARVKSICTGLPCFKQKNINFKPSCLSFFGVCMRVNSYHILCAQGNHQHHSVTLARS